MKRQRGRGRKSNGGHHHHQPNRNFESSGPDIKIRGSASHVYDKYQQLARDASSAGDRVAEQSYLQHAEHYFRVMRSQQQHQRERAEEQARFGGQQQGGGQGQGQPGQGGQGGGNYDPHNAANGRGEDYDDLANPGEPLSPQPQHSHGPLDVVDPEAEAPQPHHQGGGQQGGGDRDDDRGRRHRRRRRSEGGGGHQGGGHQQGQGGGNDGGESREGSPSPTLDRAPSN